MTLSGLSWEAQLALFAPYCGGRERESILRQALAMLPFGEHAGERTLFDAPAHRFFLRWDPVQAPLEPCRCVLRFESHPGVDYRFECPAHQLLSWLMEGRCMAAATIFLTAFGNGSCSAGSRTTDPLNCNKNHQIPAWAPRC
jgi:hypothetical protein